MKDFTTVGAGQPPRQFSIDGEVFHFAAVLPGDTLVKVARVEHSENTTDQVDALVLFLESVLVPESAQRFATRFASPENPIDLSTAIDVMMWIVEESQDRPTTPTVSLPAGPLNGGSGSGDTASPPLVGAQQS